MRSAISALLISIAVALAVGGCGSDSNAVPSKAEYQKDYRPLSADTSALGAKISTALNNTNSSSDGKQVAKQFGDLADSAHSLAKKIAGTTPPADPKITADQKALAKGLNTSGDDLDAIAAAAKKYDFKAAGVAAKSLGGHLLNVAVPHQSLDVVVLGKKPTAAPQSAAG